MSAETKNDFNGLVTRLGGDALFALISGKKTWHDLVHGIASGTAMWAADTITNPIRIERNKALATLEEVKKTLEPAFLPLRDTEDKACKYCGARLYKSGIGTSHSEECIYRKVCFVLEETKT